MRYIFLACAPLLLAPFGCVDDEEPSRAHGIGAGTTQSPGPVAGLGGEESQDPEGSATTGTVMRFTDDDFNSTVNYGGLAQVFVSSESGTSFSETPYDGAEFLIESDVLGQRWVRVAPTSDTSIVATMSLQTLGEEAVSAPLLPRVTLEEMAASLTDPLEIVDTRAHLVLRIVDESGGGIEGVSVDLFVAGVPTVAFKQGFAWQTNLDATTVEGLIFVPNLAAIAYPGQAIQVVLTGATEAELDVRLAAETVTFVNHVVL